jgi:hypothetical protein
VPKLAKRQMTAQSEKPGLLGLVLEQKGDFLRANSAARVALDGFKVGAENKFWELQAAHRNHEMVVRVGYSLICYAAMVVANQALWFSSASGHGGS